jgi:hypothetical protein
VSAAPEPNVTVEVLSTAGSPTWIRCPQLAQNRAESSLACPQCVQNGMVGPPEGNGNRLAAAEIPSGAP